jgi:uncharacterized membrane protein YiaA
VKDMKKLKLISIVLITIGFLSFLGGIFANMKELLEYGIYIGLTGVIGFAGVFLFGSTRVANHKALSD